MTNNYVNLGVMVNQIKMKEELLKIWRAKPEGKRNDESIPQMDEGCDWL